MRNMMSATEGKPQLRDTVDKKNYRVNHSSRMEYFYVFMLREKTHNVSK